MELSEEVRLSPTLYQINTRTTLTALGQGSTLHDISDNFLDQIAERGFDWVWLLGVWQTGKEGRTLAKNLPQLYPEYREALPDLVDSDICGSPFAISSYTVHEEFGGNTALANFRERLRIRGVKLLLDFVPNHVARDHHFREDAPEFLIEGSDLDLQRSPYDFFKAPSGRIFAHGRDPFFDGWSDTLQLNYANPELQKVMKEQLHSLTSLCDGIRCDMAMLLLPEVFKKTWDNSFKQDQLVEDFWDEAIKELRLTHPDFLLLAEVYWGLEDELVKRGFNYTYDKTLYDRLISGDTSAVRDHLKATSLQRVHCARFLENHDELRAAKNFSFEKHKAAAFLTYLSSGLRFFHQGQLEGAKVKVPMQLARKILEQTDPNIACFYMELLKLLNSSSRQITCQVLTINSAWDENSSYKGLISFATTDSERCLLITAVNYSASQAQCFLKLDKVLLDTATSTNLPTVVFTDLFSGEIYTRDLNDLMVRGLYLDVPPWKTHVFKVSAVPL